MPDMTRDDADSVLFTPVRRAFSSYHLPRSEARDNSPISSASGRRLLALTVAGVSAGAVVLAALLLQSLTAPRSAFAGWTAVPSPPDPAAAAIVEHECREYLHHPADDPNFEPMYDEETRRKVDAMADPATLPLVAHDRRGEVTLAFFTDGHTYASCAMEGTDRGGYVVTAVGWIQGERTGPVRLLSGMRSGGGSAGSPPLRRVIGDVAPEVSSVVIERAEGEAVTATVSGGYFVAWWPTDADILRIIAYDEQGNELGFN
jgi:hypothetical protein